jgi:uncharacterized membrane protein
MGFVVALPALAVLIGLNKRIKGKPKNKQAKAGVALFTLVVAFAVGCGIAYTFLGRWGASAVSWLAGLAGSGIEHAAPLALTVLAILWATGDVLYDRKADKGAQFAVIVLPTLLALVVGGQLGASGGNAVNEFFVQAHSVVSQLGGA